MARKPQAGEDFDDLRTRQLVVGDEAHFQAEERGDGPIDDGLGGHIHDI